MQIHRPPALVPRGEHRKVIQQTGGKCYGYARVSKGEQGDGYSIDVQKEQIESYYNTVVSKTGAEMANIFTDIGFSAFKKELTERPAGKFLISAATRGDHIVVAKLDRMCRSLKDVLQLTTYFKTQGIFLHMIDFRYNPLDPFSELTMHQLAIVAELDSKIKSMRVNETFDSMKRAGTFRYGKHKSVSLGSGIEDEDYRCCGIRGDSSEPGKLKLRICWMEFAMSWWTVRMRQEIKHFANTNKQPSYQYLADAIDRWYSETIEGKPWVKSAFKPQRYHKERWRKTVNEVWPANVQPILDILPFIPYPPAPELQRQEIDWVVGHLNQIEEVDHWEPCYPDEGHPSIFDLPIDDMRGNQ